MGAIAHDWYPWHVPDGVVLGEQWGERPTALYVLCVTPSSTERSLQAVSFVKSIFPLSWALAGHHCVRRFIA